MLDTIREEGHGIREKNEKINGEKE